MWDFLSKILNVLLGLVTIYFYIENRKLKGFELDRDIGIKRLEIDELKRWYPREKEKLAETMASRGLAFSGIRNREESELEKQYQGKILKLTHELEYLERLRRYRWIFNK